MHKDSSLRVLPYLQVLPCLARVCRIHERGGRGVAEGRVRAITTSACVTTLAIRGHQQVSDVLHVYLKEADCDAEYSLVWILFDVAENVADDTRHYTGLDLCCPR